MQKTADQNLNHKKNLFFVLRPWLSLTLAVGLALAGWLALSRLSQVGASAVSSAPFSGGVTHIWPTETINTPMASGRSFINMTGRSLAYYTNKNRTIQQLHLAYGGKNLYYATSTWSGSGWSAWTSEVVDSAANVGEWASIAVDPFNRPHIAYYDKANGCLKYAFKDVVWSIQTLDCDNTLLPVSDEGMLALSDGVEEVEIQPTLVSPEETQGFPLRQEALGAQSESNLLAEPSAGSGKYTSIAIDSRGQPHISYAKFYPRSDRTYHKLKYAYYDRTASAWKIFLVREAGPGVASLDEGLFTSIAIDSRDRPHIAFLDDTHDKVRYAFSLREGHWTFSYPLDPSNYEPNVGGWNSLVTRPAKPQDKVYIAFYDKSRGALSVVEGTYNEEKKNYDWKKQVVDRAGDVGLFASMADKDGKDFGISYFDESWDDLRFALGSGDKWSTGIVTGTNSRAGRYTSLVFDFNQKPHITYFDFSEGMLYEAYQITTTWKFRPIDLSDTLGSAAISLDGARNPRVLYYNGLLGALEVASRSTGWRADTVIASRLSTDQRVAFVVDRNGRSHLAYYDPVNRDLVYGLKEGLDWRFEVLDSLGDVGHNPALALNSENRPYLSYYDATNGRVKLAFKNSLGQWQTEVIQAVGNAAGSFSSIAIHPTTKDIYVSFYDASSQTLKLAHTPPAASHVWSITEVDTAPKSGVHNALALDAGGRPVLAYYEATGKVLKFARAANSIPPFNFAVTTVDDRGSVGQYCSLGVDAENRFHVSYYDEANRDLRYAFFDGSGWSTQIVDWAGDVGMWSSLVVDPLTNIPHILYYDGTNRQWKYTIDRPWKIESQIFLPLVNR
ncbi:MAG: hypothetical protein NZ840_10745 [Anaerolineales bacterium]|nr:hypothetical protein [Anaerolineales bacterium]MDW8162515.1 hypothetical protein [Anaerolineales bacterium]